MTFMTTPSPIRIICERFRVSMSIVDLLNVLNGVRAGLRLIYQEGHESDSAGRRQGEIQVELREMQCSCQRVPPSVEFAQLIASKILRRFRVRGPAVRRCGEGK